MSHYDTLPTSQNIEDFTNKVFHADCLELLKALPDKSVDLIATDPPYFRVKDADWDNAWESEATFIAWLKTILAEYRRVLADNGTLYLFASPQMAAKVEIATGEYFNVLNHIVWSKPHSRHSQADTDALRGFFPQTERIILAEQYGADMNADELSGFTDAENALKRRLFGDEIRRAMEETNTSTHELVEVLKAYRKHNHGGAASNWLAGYNIPTKEQYEKMRDYLNTKNGAGYLARDYEALRQEFEALRQEFEALRQEFESLRRPFNASDYRPYTDVWTFRTVQAYEGKHECEKPLSMMRHIIETSSRPNGIVLDTFAGSGTTLDAARQLGRRFIGCDSDSKWVSYAKRRVESPFTVSMFEAVQA